MNKYSQINEETIISGVFDLIGATNAFCVEFGAGNGYQHSNTRFLLDYGWKYLMMDADNHGNEDIKKEFITVENINSLLSKYKVPKDMDLLSIDMDGNDVWVLDEILKFYKPRIIVAEFNPAIPVGINKAIKYNPDHKWDNDEYYGASMEAFKVLAAKFGYGIVDHNGLNLFMIRSDINPYSTDRTGYIERHDHAPSTKGEWVKYK